MLELTSFKSSLFFYQPPRLDISILLELMASFERELDEMGQKALSVPGNQAGDRCRVVVWNLQGPKCSRWQEFWDPVDSLTTWSRTMDLREVLPRDCDRLSGLLLIFNIFSNLKNILRWFLLNPVLPPPLV